MTGAKIEAWLEEFFLDEDVQHCRSLVGRRNIFEIIYPQEVHYSRILAWLLDPQEGHGLGDYFIKALFRAALRQQNSANNCKSNFLNGGWTSSEIDSHSFASAIVITEFSPKSFSGRVDIAVIDNVNFVAVFIENKTGSKEGSNSKKTSAQKFQTAAYRASLSADKKLENYYQGFVYLDLYQNEAKDNEWVSLGYDWLEECLKRVLARDMLPKRIEVILSDLHDDLAETLAYDEYYKEFQEKLSLVANKHSGLIDEIASMPAGNNHSDFLRPEQGQDVAEREQLAKAYVQNSTLFDALCSFSKYDHVVRKIRDAFNGKEIDHYIGSNKFQIHLDEWSSMYNDEVDTWGLWVNIERIRDDSGEETAPAKYQIESKCRASHFKNSEIPGALVNAYGIRSNGVVLRSEIVIGTDEVVRKVTGVIEDLVSELKKIT